MTPPPLSVDGQGRVHGANVEWTSPWPVCNGTSGGMAVPSGVMGVLMHTMVGNLPGTVSWFHNPTAEASAHFGIDQTGHIVQFGPVNGWKAWHAEDGNPHWYGIEHADNGNPDQSLTQPQMDASAQLVELLSRPTVGRFALQVSNDPGTEGYGWHGMSPGFGHPNCPGPVRKLQRAPIIEIALAIRNQQGDTVTITTPPPGNWEGDVVVLGKGADGNLWETRTSDGRTWSEPVRQ